MIITNRAVTRALIGGGGGGAYTNTRVPPDEFFFEINCSNALVTALITKLIIFSLEPQSFKASMSPAAHPVLRITLVIRNIPETVVSYLAKPTWRRQERHHKCGEYIHILYMIRMCINLHFQNGIT